MILVLRSNFPAFSASSSVAVAGTLCSEVLASADGRWLVLRTPSLQQLQCSGPECGYSALIVSTPAGSRTPAVAASRRLSDNTTVAFRGATLSCPPFCPGLPLPTTASRNSSIDSGVLVPVALDASGSSFVAVSQMSALAAPVAAAAAASSSGASSSGGSSGVSGSSGFGMYYSQTCSSGSFTDPLSGACTNVSDPASSDCALGAGSSCTRCPAGALCPSGTRLWPRPGYYVGSERDSSTVPCAPPSPETRCKGWDAIAGITSCGRGYRQASFMCASCSDGYASVDDGSCTLCPTSSEPQSFITAFWAAYKGLALLSLAVVSAVLSAFVTLVVAQRCKCCFSFRFVRTNALYSIGEYDPFSVSHIDASSPVGKMQKPGYEKGVSVASKETMRFFNHSLMSIVWLLLAIQLSSQVCVNGMYSKFDFVASKLCIMHLLTCVPSHITFSDCPCNFTIAPSAIEQRHVSCFGSCDFKRLRHRCNMCISTQCSWHNDSAFQLSNWSHVNFFDSVFHYLYCIFCQ